MAKAHGKHWSEEQTSLAVALWNDGKSAREIAHILVCSRNAVIGRINRLARAGKDVRRSDMRHWTETEIAELVSFWRDGVHVKEIAKAFHRSPQIIYAKVCHLRRSGINLERRND